VGYDFARLLWREQPPLIWTMVWVAFTKEAPHSSPWTFAIFGAELRGKLDRRDRADGGQQPKHDGMAEVVIPEGERPVEEPVKPTTRRRRS
jgi:hypothetical protein